MEHSRIFLEPPDRMDGEEEYGRLRFAPNHVLHILREAKIYVAAFSSSPPQPLPKDDPPEFPEVGLPGIWINPALPERSQPVAWNNLGRGTSEKGRSEQLPDATGLWPLASPLELKPFPHRQIGQKLLRSQDRRRRF